MTITTGFQKISLLFLRLSMGWLFIYAGFTKIINTEWSAAPYLENAKLLKSFFSFLTEPGIIEVVNILNKWGLLLIGIALIFGVLMKITTFFGGVLMILYYLPILDFPYPNSHSFIVDEHVIYIFAFAVLFAFSDNLALFSRTQK